MTVILPLPGIIDAFDGEQFATYLGPRKTSHDADLIFKLSFTMAVLRHAEEVVDVLGGDDQIDVFPDDVRNLLHGLTRQLRDFTLERDGRPLLACSGE